MGHGEEPILMSHWWTEYWHKNFWDGWLFPVRHPVTHQIIEFTIDLQRRQFVHRATRYNLATQNYQVFRQEYENRDGLRDAVNIDPEGMVQELADDVTAAAMLHAVKKRIRLKVTPPWWTNQLQAARRAVRAAARRMSADGYRQSYNARRNEYTTLLRRSKLESWRAFCTTEGVQPWGRLYRWLKNGSKKQTSIGLLTKADGTRCWSLDESVDLLLNTLIPNDPHQQLQDGLARTECDLQPLDETTVRDLTWTMAPNRAPGKDGITGRMVRVLWPRLSARVLALVYACLRDAVFPAIWKSADVVPILKGEDRDVAQPKSYRQVSLLPVVGKIVEKAMNKRLQDQIG